MSREATAETLDEHPNEYPDRAEQTDHVPPRRGWVPVALVVVATVLTVLSAVTTWVRVQALDTDEWATASSGLLADPAVRAAMATYLVDELYLGLGLADQLEAALPDTLSGLAGVKRCATSGWRCPPVASCCCCAVGGRARRRRCDRREPVEPFDRRRRR